MPTKPAREFVSEVSFLNRRLFNMARDLGEVEQQRQRLLERKIALGEDVGEVEIIELTPIGLVIAAATALGVHAGLGDNGGDNGHGNRNGNGEG
jgi:hypothetical protein